MADGDVNNTVDDLEADDLALEYISDIPVEVTVVLGKTQMPVGQLLKLGRGAVIKLDKKVGEAIDILVNDRLVARGEVVIVENHVGVTMTEIIKSQKEALTSSSS